MHFGMAVEFEGGLEFLDKLAGAKFKYVRLNIPESAKKAEIQEFFNKFDELDMKAYVSMFDVKQTPIQADRLFPLLGEKSSKLKKRFSQVLGWIPEERTLGVGLVSNIWRALRSNAQSKYGMDKAVLVDVLKSLADSCRERGFKSVMSVRPQDIRGQTWNQVGFDIYDIGGMVGNGFKFQKFKADKPIWFGECGIVGGYVVSQQLSKILDQAYRYGEGVADYAFLFSKPKLKSHSWSQNGEFVVDFMTRRSKKKFYIEPEGEK